MVFNNIKKIFSQRWTKEELLSAEEARKMIPWMHPWEPFEDQKGGTVKELRKEMTSKHILYKKKLIPIGHRVASDDVLFKIFPDGQYAEVHLTFHQETSPTWPFTTLYKSIDAWVVHLKKENAWCKEVAEKVKKENDALKSNNNSS